MGVMPNGMILFAAKKHSVNKVFALLALASREGKKACFGPSLMPGAPRKCGNTSSQSGRRSRLKWTPTRVNQSGAAPGKPVEGGFSCTAYIGPNGAGHYVKMVHNGIEYGDMQMICEAYDLMQNVLGLSPSEMGEIFPEWNQGFDSFLIEITADILKQSDPVTGQPFVDQVLDTAGRRTGK